MNKVNLSAFIRPDIAEMEEYIPVPSLWDLSKKFKVPIKNVVKLDAGENIFGFSPNVTKLLKKFSFFNYYPDPEYKELRYALSRYTEVDVANIIVSSGSDELLDLLLRLVIDVGDKVINCPPTFGMYSVLTTLNRGVVISVPRNEDFSLNISGIKKAIDKKVKIILVCSPNNPTGTVIGEKEIVTLLQTGKLIVVDEAYFEFCGKTVAPLLKVYDNLIILRTLSKWAGLAGLRLGYGLMSPFFVRQLQKVKLPYNVNLAAVVAARTTLKDLSYTKASVIKIVSERDRLYKRFKHLPNIRVYPSSGNFIFIQTVQKKYKYLKQSFEKNNITVRYYPELNYGIRITVGKPQQNNKVFEIVDKETNKKKYAFIDRDGTLIFEPQDTYQVDSIEKLKILDGVIRGLKNLKKRGYELIMVTNQDGLGTSSFPLINFCQPHNKILRMFQKEGITFKKIFICPHLPVDRCRCRKPKTGLVKKFININGIDKDESFVCGDRESDKQFADNLGLKFIAMKTNGNFYEALTKKEVFL